MAKRIISFSLWGNNPKYTIGAIKNTQLAPIVYPDWICRFYISNEVSNEIIKKLEQTSEIVKVNNFGNWKLTVERFKAIDDDIECAIFRDTDSRLNFREKAAVDEWLKSDKTMHVMKDHPYHAGFPILAGMWGLKKKGFDLNMTNMLKLYSNSEQYHYDQIFLNNFIWKYYADDCIIHDEFFNNKPFPTKRSSLHFVGQVYDENDLTPDEHIQILQKHI